MSPRRLLSRLVRALALLFALLVVVAAVALLALYVTTPSPRIAGWTQAAPLPEARGESATVAVGNQLYVLGGLAGFPPRTVSDVTVYEPFTDSWFGAPALPEPRHHLAAASLEGTLFVSGGAETATDWLARDNLWQLTVGTTDWTALPSMPEPRLGHRMVALDGRLYVVGGVGGSGATLIFDPATASWAMGAPLPQPRDHLAAVALNGEIWAIGGRDAAGTTARVDIYDPPTDAWREGPALPAATSGAAEGTVDSIIVISGGEDPSLVGGGIVDRHWFLDARTVEDREDETAGQGWSDLPPPALPVHGAQGAFLGHRFYVAGGAARAGALSAISWSDLVQVIVVAE